MENIIQEKIAPFFASLNPAFIFLIIFLIGLILFWRGSIETRKHRSSIFDIFFISSFFSLLISRIMFIINNWSLFSGYIWYWLPYERYGEEAYFFRLLPWRFINIFDGGIEIFAMFVSFIIVATFVVIVIKKWRWKDMFYVIFFSAEVMLSLAFLFSGLSNGNVEWVSQSGVLLIPVILIFLINGIFRKTGDEGRIPLAVFVIFLINLSAAYVLFIYINKESVLSDMIWSGVLILWVIIGTIFRIKDERRSSLTIERVSSVRTVSPVEINQPIKVKK